jgi:hypothetical protein
MGMPCDKAIRREKHGSGHDEKGEQGPEMMAERGHRHVEP